MTLLTQNSLVRLALGTVQFGLPYGVANKVGQVSSGSGRDMLEFAATSGLDTIDTAISYGDSETRLGKIGVQRFKVVTKLPPMPLDVADVRSWVRQQIRGAAQRLRVERIYGLLLHRPLDLLEPGGSEIFNALLESKEHGLVEKIGVSVYSPVELQMLNVKYAFDLVQAPFNLLDRRLFTSGWLGRLKDDGVEIHTRSAFLQGLLLMSRNSIPEKFAPWSDSWDKWHKWLSSQEQSAVSACLAFPLSFPEIDRVVVGADGLSQLQEIVAAVDGCTTNEIPSLECNEEKLINPANWANF